jgi:hypothetical protein
LHKAFVIVPILGWAGVAALVHYARLPFPDRSDEGTVVVVPSRAAATSGHTPLAHQPSRVVPPPGNRAALVRELHRELTRVGCYDGEISGIWTAASRRAMRTFTVRVNAKLPTSEPDQILLSLVQGHRGKACGTACPAGQQEDRTGRCVPSALAGAAKQPAPAGAPVDPATLAAAAALAAGMSQLDRSSAASPAKPAHAKPAPAGTATSPGPGARDGPAPGVGVQEAKRQRPARRSKPPPTGVEALVRGVKDALGIR